MCAETVSRERMDNQESEQTPAAVRERLVAHRLQIGVVLLAVVLALNGVLDVTTRPGGLRPVMWIYATQFVLVAAVWTAMRRPRSPRETVTIAASAVMLWNALFCSYAMLSPGEIHV